MSRLLAPRWLPCSHLIAGVVYCYYSDTFVDGNVATAAFRPLLPGRFHRMILTTCLTIPIPGRRQQDDWFLVAQVTTWAESVSPVRRPRLITMCCHSQSTFQFQLPVSHAFMLIWWDRRLLCMVSPIFSWLWTVLLVGRRLCFWLTHMQKLCFTAGSPLFGLL